MFRRLNRAILLVIMCLVIAISANAATSPPKKKQAPVKQLSELDQLRMNMRSKVDQVEGIKWIHDKATSQYVQKSNCYIYLGQRDGSTWGRFVLGFKAERWVFAKKIIMNIDGERISLIDVSYSDFARDNSSGSVWETADLPLSSYRAIAEQIAKSKKTIIRFEGDRRHFDITVSQKQKDAMKRVLRLHDLFNKRS